MQCEHIEPLLSGYIDGELTQGDSQRVEVHIDECSNCRERFEQMSKLRQAVGDLSFSELSRDEWSKIMNDLPVRTSRRLGWIFYLGGFLVLMAYAGYEFWNDASVPALVRVSVGALILGLLCLFYSVLRQRLIDRKTDKYKDVEI